MIFFFGPSNPNEVDNPDIPHNTHIFFILVNSNVQKQKIYNQTMSFIHSFIWWVVSLASYLYICINWWHEPVITCTLSLCGAFITCFCCCRLFFMMMMMTWPTNQPTNKKKFCLVGCETWQIIHVHSYGWFDYVFFFCCCLTVHFSLSFSLIPPHTHTFLWSAWWLYTCVCYQGGD